MDCAGLQDVLRSLVGCRGDAGGQRADRADLTGSTALPSTSAGT